MPNRSTVLLWVVDGEHPEFSAQYARAREAQGHALADSMIDLHGELRDGIIDDRRAKVIQDGIKWQAERLARKQFGHRQEIEHRGPSAVLRSEPMTIDAWVAKYVEDGSKDIEPS